LIRLQRVILRDPDFFRRLPVHTGLSSARHFWWGTFLLLTVTPLVVANLMYYLPFGSRAGLFPALPVFAIVAPAVLALQSAVMFAACLWAQVRLGIGDYRVSAVVCYYASPLIWPVLLVAMLAGTIVASPAGLWLSEQILWVGARGFILRGTHAAALVMLLAAAGSVWFWAWRLLRGLAAVRYANA